MNSLYNESICALVSNDLSISDKACLIFSGGGSFAMVMPTDWVRLSSRKRFFSGREDFEVEDLGRVFFKAKWETIVLRSISVSVIVFQMRLGRFGD